MKAERWAKGIRQILGGDPRTPEEALRALGSFLRANPTEKEEFLREAHEVWVRGISWEIRDRSPVAVVVLAALEEATRRLAERHGWKRKEDKPVTRVTGDDVWSQRIRIVVSNPRGEGVDFWFSGEINQKVLWAAAFAVAQGKQICVAVPSPQIGEKVKRMIATRAARVAKQKSGDKYLTPWGKEIPLLPGDRWEHPDWDEPRIAEAVRALREILEEEGPEEDPEPDRPWPHQTRLPRWAIRAILENQGEDLEGVGWEYLHLLEREALEALDSLTLSADVYYEGDLRSLLGRTPGARSVQPWFAKWARRVPTYGEVFQDWRDFLEVGDKEIWYWGKMVQHLAPIIAHRVVLMGVGDPEPAFWQALHHGLKVAQRLRRRRKWAAVNPIAILVHDVAHFLSELRAEEQGVFRLSRRDAQALREYFAKLSLGETPELPGHLRQVLGGECISIDSLKDCGVEPSEEVDYDYLILRGKVREVIEEVKLLWGDPGLAFVEALMDGATPEGAGIRSGLPRAQAEEILAYLRQELEGWAG